jgi:acyl-CoA synthetase (AMP-forming)/AMP-acid ligase II
VGGFCWIVDPENPHCLAPTGTVGEVVIQGPTVLREYLSDAERTEAALVKSLPEWAPFRGEASWSRLYKSGDLCFYNSDGTIQFSSRKDTQVKIRGLRVELGEIEHHIRLAPMCDKLLLTFSKAITALISWLISRFAMKLDKSMKPMYLGPFCQLKTICNLV